MLGTENLGLFIVAGLLLNITPGADLLYIGSRSATQGKAAGVVAALGIGCGCLVHIILASLGLSVILTTSAIAFTVVKILGGGYLIYLGLATLRSLVNRNKPTILSDPGGIAIWSGRKIFLQAVLVNSLNPKVALFFMALLPQFVSPEASAPPLSFLFLGLIFNLNGTIINICFALLFARMADVFRSSRGIGRALKATTGVLFLFLGLRLLTASQR